MKQKLFVPINHRETVEDLIEQNVDQLAEEDTDLGKTNTIKMSTDTGSHPPMKLRPYRTPFAKHPIVDKAVNDMLAVNIMHTSRSSWSCPIVILDKKDGTKRFYTEFRKLNNISKTSSWPLLVIDDMFQSLMTC